jgi:hypothetical protein
MKCLNSLIDPTIPNKDHFVAGGKHAGLEDDLDALGKGLRGPPEKQRATFFERILALAKKRDLLFRDVHSLALGRHPEWLRGETLHPRQYAAKLPTRTERRQAEAELEKLTQEEDQKKISAHADRMAQIERIKATGKTFAEAWDATLEPQTIQAEEMDPAQAAGEQAGVALRRFLRPAERQQKAVFLVRAVDDGRQH